MRIRTNSFLMHLLFFLDILSLLLSYLHFILILIDSFRFFSKEVKRKQILICLPWFSRLLTLLDWSWHRHLRKEENGWNLELSENVFVSSSSLCSTENDRISSKLIQTNWWKSMESSCDRLWSFALVIAFVRRSSHFNEIFWSNFRNQFQRENSSLSIGCFDQNIKWNSSWTQFLFTCPRFDLVINHWWNHFNSDTRIDYSIWKMTIVCQRNWFDEMK